MKQSAAGVTRREAVEGAKARGWSKAAHLVRNRTKSYEARQGIKDLGAAVIERSTRAGAKLEEFSGSARRQLKARAGANETK